MNDKVCVSVKKKWIGLKVYFVISVDEPDEWLFQTGIAYPSRDRLNKTTCCKIAIPDCPNTRTLYFGVSWNRPTLLQFDVLDQPTPMRELNPFWDVHPHISMDISNLRKDSLS